MILDYNYNASKQKFNISYINNKGSKELLEYNVSKFKSYYKTTNGRYNTYDNYNCDICYTDKPSKFDIKYFIKELESSQRLLLENKTFPKVYSFDIETMIPDNNDFPEPSEGKYPITTISIANQELDCIVLGTKEISDIENSYIKDSFNKYLNDTQFYNDDVKQYLKKTPSFKYLKFDNEENMLKYFLKNIVSKVPILIGWNNILFDWYYITSRIKNYFPNIHISLSSYTQNIHYQQFTDINGDKIKLPMPDNTLILDMMSIIKDEDKIVLPIKESYGLNYIANASMGINKIEYDGTLQDLYNKDYKNYVFYNAIDSILVQLINKRFKTIDHIYMYSLYCEEKIGKCFSKIAVSEALVFKDFYDRDLKIVYEKKEQTEDRGKLIGAYVKTALPGIHKFICCNDFASLYPSTIRTCNLSFENFLGTKNDFTQEEIEKFKKNPNYFVSIDENVYKNDKDYTFKRIQTKLKSNRDVSKYLSKDLEAEVITTLDKIIKNKKLDNKKEFSKSLQDILKNINDINNIDIIYNIDLLKFSTKEIVKFKHKLLNEITYYNCHEQAMKYLMNSMYGGCSHNAFYWFNMHLANDITGESRNLINLIEKHITEYFNNNWISNKKLHNIIGIEKLQDNLQDKFNKNFIKVIYCDTDSLFISYENLLKSIYGYEQMTLQDKLDILIKLNRLFLDNHNKEFIKDYYTTRFSNSVHDFELETISLSGMWLDVKKRYMQLLLWKDNKTYDFNNLPLKIKGLEAVKGSYPKISRDILMKLYRYMLETSDENYLLPRLNKKMSEYKKEFMGMSIEHICKSVKINNYKKYIIDDSDKILKCHLGTPFNVRALGYYNWLRNTYKLPGEPIYGGKLKYYQVKKNSKNSLTQYFAFSSNNLPEWSQKYAPIDKESMFQSTILDPFNRILTSNNIQNLNSTGELQLELF